jgi:hypothetical protein
MWSLNRSPFPRRRSRPGGKVNLGSGRADDAAEPVPMPEPDTEPEPEDPVPLSESDPGVRT